uniref:(northern house mosquito) hypothetical protein n=1 Tax=Culex pipiens TaxID=7175 RepID=A0A8D8F4L7_CULPI
MWNGGVPEHWNTRLAMLPWWTHCEPVTLNLEIGCCTITFRTKWPYVFFGSGGTIELLPHTNGWRESSTLKSDFLMMWAGSSPESSEANFNRCSGMCSPTIAVGSDILSSRGLTLARVSRREED